MNDCKYCEYKENCEFGLYVVPPCECREKVYRDMVDVFAPVVHEYQNPFTGKFEPQKVDEFYIKNPFLMPF